MVLEQQVIWSWLREHGVSEEALDLVTDINGYTVETLNDVLFTRFGYHSLDQID